MEKIWIYIISKELNSEQLMELKERCLDFTSNWTAHDMSLDASYELYKNRLLIFKVNEDKYGASGCSIDKQLRFVKELETIFSVELLNRLLVAYEIEDEIYITKQSHISELLSKKVLDENTIIFNNTITKSSELKDNWKLPLKQTWLSKYLIQKV